MSRMSSMEEAYAKLDQDQIDEIEEKFARADAAQKIFEKWSQEDIDRTIRAVIIVFLSKKIHLIEGEF
jgi:sulfoacetaldehyde dehydrogenase